MRITVIGAGRVGSALGERWAAVGHEITYAVRNPDDPRYSSLRRVATVADAARDVDVVLVALPWDVSEAVLADLDVGDAVVIDAMNPPAAEARGPEPDRPLSGAERVAAWTGSRRVVKAFNTTGSGNMADTSYPVGMPAMFVAGDDVDAKDVVLGLAREIGFDVIDAGPLSAALDLEHLAMIWIRLAYSLGNGPDIAFALLRR